MIQITSLLYGILFWIAFLLESLLLCTDYVNVHRFVGSLLIVISILTEINV